MDGVLSQEEINALLNNNDAADSSDEILTESEKDAIGEIANISMGTAATTLFSLVNRRVEISTPVVSFSNWDKIDFGEKLQLYIDKDGNTGQQYYTEEVGYIDILAKDHKGDMVVIELKKGRKDDEVIGQILRYIGWVRKNLAQKGQKVRGLVIVGERDQKLDYALAEMDDKISAKVYKVSFKLHNY